MECDVININDLGVPVTDLGRSSSARAHRAIPHQVPIIQNNKSVAQIMNEGFRKARGTALGRGLSSGGVNSGRSPCSGRVWQVCGALLPEVVR